MWLILNLLAADRRLRAVVLALTAGGVMLLYLALGDGGFPLDDSWIHQVYARNLGERGEWAFIPGQPSGASTSPAYTLLLAVGYALNIDFMIWAHGLGWVALALAGIIAAHLVDLALPGRVLPAWLAGFAVVLSWHLIWAAASGMETMLFCTAVLGFTLLTWREWRVRDHALGPLGRGAAFGLMTALLVAIRPEGALLAAIAAGLMLVARPPGWERLALGAALAFAVGLVPYLLLNLSLNDSLVPNTSAAKQAQHAPLLDLPYTERLVDMLLPVLAGGQIFLLPGAVIAGGWALERMRRGDRGAVLALLPLLWAAALVMLYAARLPASYQHGRYVIPILPGLVVAGVIGLALFVRSWRSIPGARVLPLTIAIAAGMTVVYFAVVQGPTIYRTDQRVINDEMVALAQWVPEGLPDDALLAVHDIGALGYYAPRPILDIAGLVTPEVVARIGDPDALWALMCEREADFLMAFPDQIPNQNPDDPRLEFYYETPGTGSTDIGGPKMTIYRLAWDGEC